MSHSINMQPGSIFSGRYEIISMLGQGGTSHVYHAYDTSSDPQIEVALKIYKTSMGGKNFMARFLREAFQLSRLNHPNIMKLIDFGNDGGIYFMATEFIKGKSLKEYLIKNPIAEESAVVIGSEMSKAFTYMRDMGVIHRDIKPDNILISDAEQVILVDFGLAKEQGQQTISKSDELYGTPQYLSPEYITESSKVDIKTDIYSLGITLFYAVSGILPFNDTNPMEVIRQQLNATPPSLIDIKPNITAEYSDLIGRMLEKKPEQRCSLEEMAQGFEQLLMRYI